METQALTSKTLESFTSCAAMHKKIMEMKSGDEIVYFTGETGHVNCGQSLKNSPESAWPLFRMLWSYRESGKYNFFQRKLTQRQVGLNDYDYIICKK